MRFCSFPLVLLFTGIAYADDRPTPKYEGKSLDYWVAKFENPVDVKERNEAADALKAFGKDAAPAIPKLLVMLEDKSSDYRGRVWRVFMAMKDSAAPAVPTLVKRLEEGSCADPREVIEIIGNMGPKAKDAVPVLTKLVATDEKLKWWATQALCEIGPDAAKEGFPAILAAVRSDAKRVPFLSEEISKLGPDIIPGLLELLDKPAYGLDPVVVIYTLAKLGSKAKGALPALKKLLPTADESKAMEEFCERGEKSEVARHSYWEKYPDMVGEKPTDAERRAIAYASAYAVAKIEPCKEAVVALVLWVRRSDARSVTHEVQLIGRSGEVSALPILEQKLKVWSSNMTGNEQEIYREAIAALRRAKDQKK